MSAMSVVKALRDPRLRRFPLRRQRIPVAGGALSMVTPRSLNAVLAQGGRPERVARGAAPMPYWADIWPASVAIARAVMRGPPLAGLGALDVGCGLGLAGTACGRRGAAVTFLDRDPDALRFAAFNAAQNGVERFEVLQGDWAAVAERCGQFDLVVLSDVTYEPAERAPLLQLLRGHLAPGGECLFGDAHRPAGDAFLAAAAAELLVQVDDTDAYHDGRRVEVRLARIRHP
jgi:predicted nicotinamide N-methyase